jgi:hypothetical protein
MVRSLRDIAGISTEISAAFFADNVNASESACGDSVY